MATRALQRMLRARTPNTPIPGMFQPNGDVWVWYSSKNNEPNEWVHARIVQTHTHYLEVQRVKNGHLCRGPTMKPAYEDIRLVPKGKLARTLMAQSLDEALGYDMSAERGVNTDDILERAPPPNVPTMLTQVTSSKGAKEDIGTYSSNITTKESELAETLKSEKSRVLEEIYDQVGSQQVSRHKLDFAPLWVMEQAFAKEFDNRADAFEMVNEENVPPDANVITSHTVYKVKTSEDRCREMKARIVPHGNHDNEKDSIRKDSATAQLSVIRLLLSIVTLIGFRLATADIKGAYLQSGPVRRDIYVRPPREWVHHKSHKKYTLWKLAKLPYGVVEAGRQWQNTVEDWMLNFYGLERVFGLSQLFIKRDSSGNIKLLIAKVTDDFLIGGHISAIRHFVSKLEQRFTVGKVVINSKFHFNGCEIVQDEFGNIRMSMLRYLESIKPITISRSRRKQLSDKATPKELKQYRALAGTLLYLGNGVLPQASLAVSLMQQRTAILRVEHLLDSNAMLRELLDLEPWVTFKNTRSTKSISYCSFSDASHPRDRDYGQTGTIAGLVIETTDPSNTFFHPIDWTSQKQNHVSYSSYGAEILAAAAADDRGYYFKTAMQSLFPHVLLRHELNVDSRALYDTVTTLYEGTEYRLRPTVQRIRNSFEARELDVMRWIPGKINVADALTKRNQELYKVLNELCTFGTLLLDLSSGYEVDSRTWK